MSRKPQPTERAAVVALESVLNMVLRGVTLGSKFFLMVYLARVLPPDQLGVYGIFTVTVSYALYLLGLDFYTYAQRELSSLPREDWGRILRDQITFYGVVYLAMFPVLLLVFVAGWLPWQMAGWFYLILTLEHLSQELCRFCVICGRVTLANLTLFLRGGAWVFLVVSVYWSDPGRQGLTPVWAGWAAGVALSIATAVYGVRSALLPLPAAAAADWLWMRRGLKVAALFLTGTLALRGIFTFDRYFLDLYAGKSGVGIYSFFMGIANALLAFADAGAVSRLYPGVVAAYRTGRRDEYRRLLKKLAVSIMVLNLFFAAILAVCMQPVLRYIGRAQYVEQIATLWILVLAMGLYCLGLVPHYALYAQGRDRAIVFASLTALLVFLGSAACATPRLGVAGMALSVLLGVGALGMLKMAFSWRSSQSQPG